MPETADDSRQGKPADNGSTSKKAPSGLPKAIAQLGQSGLALLLIIPAFILIGYMLFMQATAVNSAVDQVKTTMTALRPNNGTDGNTSTGIIRELGIFFQQVNASNQNMFSIILTVFGTWVGAVVAFYFGTQNLRQSQESFNRVGDVLDNTISKIPQATQAQAPKATYKTIGEMLKNYPEATGENVVTVKMDDTIKKVKETFTSHLNVDNVVVLAWDEDEDAHKIVGILYKVDLTDEIQAKFQGPGELDDKLLKDVVTLITTDDATKKPWKETGIENYVILEEDDTIEAALQEMNSKGDLSIRGIVVSEGLPTGIVNIQMLSSE